MDLTNKTVLLTGASGGIGRALALKLADAKASLILVGRQQQKLDDLIKELAGTHHSFPCDITNPKQRGQLITYATENNVAVLINNAAISDFSRFESNQSLQAIIDTNLCAPLLLCQALLPYFHTRPEAAIVNIGSTLGSVAYPGYVSYCASKFGLRGATEALRRELSDSAIQVYYAAPRATNTEILTDRERQFNQILGNTIDIPETVAQQICRQLQQEQPDNLILGKTERFASKFNALFPKLVDTAISKQLPKIKRFFAEL